MRILNVFQTYAFYGKNNQAAKIRTVSRHLARRGHDVHLLAVDYDRRFGSYAEPLDGFLIHYVGKWLKVRNATFSPEALTFALRHVAGFDVVHFYGIYDLLSLYLAPVCRARNVPYVVEPMGMVLPIVRSIRVKRAYHALLGRPLLQGAACVLATSDQERIELEAQGVSGPKVRVRANGIDLSEFRDLPARGAFRRALGVPDAAPLVLFLGRLSKKKGLDLLVRAFATLPAEAHVAMVGPDDNDGCVQELAALRRELGVEARAHVTGARFGKERLEAFADCDLFVLPSINENWGNVAAEAIACGKPAIVSEHCGIAPALGGRAGAIVRYDEAALAEAMRKLLFDAEVRRRALAECAGVAKELSWEDRIAETERIYSGL